LDRITDTFQESNGETYYYLKKWKFYFNINLNRNKINILIKWIIYN
jgi:hypothetical protein